MPSRSRCDGLKDKVGHGLVTFIRKVHARRVLKGCTALVRRAPALPNNKGVQVDHLKIHKFVSSVAVNASLSPMHEAQQREPPVYTACAACACVCVCVVWYVCGGAGGGLNAPARTALNAEGLQHQLAQQSGHGTALWDEDARELKS